MPVIDLDVAAFDELLAASEVPVVVDFWAPWCGPCRMVAPAIERIAAAHADAVVVAKVNVDEAPDVAGRYGIGSIPFIARFDSGEMTAHTVGAAPQGQLEAALSLTA